MSEEIVPQKKNRQQMPRSAFTLSQKEIKTLQNCPELSFRNRMIFKVLANTGVRVSELTGLQVEDLNVEQLSLTVRGKGNKTRIIPISQELTADLRSLIGNRNRGLIFPNPQGGRLTNAAIALICRKAQKLTGIRHPDPSQKYLNCHLFRHSFARHWKAAGLDISSLQNILGHSKASTTLDVYGQVSFADVQKNYGKFQESL